MQATITARKWYHVWSEEGCVLQAPTVAGVCFPRQTKVAVAGSEGKTEWSTRKGDYLRLTDEQVSRLKNKIMGRVQRRFQVGRAHERGIGDVYIIGAPNYIPEEGDEPLSRFLHIREVEAPPEAVADRSSTSLEAILSQEEAEFLGQPEVAAAVAANSRRKKARATAEDPAAFTVPPEDTVVG
jgi:hypothetical protein